MFKKILVPLDRSVIAEQAVGQAALIARRAHAEIDLVTVHVPFPFAGFSSEPWDEKEAAAEAKYLETIQAELRSGSDVPATYVVLNGEPADHIRLRAIDVGADLIVMTTHGRTGLSRLWLGSVADSLVRNSTVPVLMLRPAKTSRGRTAARHPFKRILVPLDGSGLAADALGPATDLARATGASLTLVRIVLPIPLMTAYDPTIPFAYQPMIADERATAVSSRPSRRDCVRIPDWRCRRMSSSTAGPPMPSCISPKRTISMSSPCRRTGAARHAGCSEASPTRCCVAVACRCSCVAPPR
jgi:nucleotide-binding universal stress UspA family protein